MKTVRFSHFRHEQISLHFHYPINPIFIMSIIRLYYITGSVLALLTVTLGCLGILSCENMIVFGLAALLLLILGIVQHILFSHEMFET